MQQTRISVRLQHVSHEDQMSIDPISSCHIYQLQCLLPSTILTANTASYTIVYMVLISL